MATMRAKMRVNSVTLNKDGNGNTSSESLKMNPVAKSDGYPADGSDEDNSYARWSPSGALDLHIANPALFGKFTVGQKLYVDFTEAAS